MVVVVEAATLVPIGTNRAGASDEEDMCVSAFAGLYVFI